MSTLSPMTKKINTAAHRPLCNWCKT